MLTVSIPGRETLELNYLVLDYNGTIAVDGALLPGVADRLAALKNRLEILVLTADTYGTVREQCAPLGVEVRTFPREGAAACKAEIVRELGGGAVCLGNGFNDIPMFDAAALSVAVLEEEGVCAALLSRADVLVPSAVSGLDLLLRPDRLRATLRS